MCEEGDEELERFTLDRSGNKFEGHDKIRGRECGVLFNQQFKWISKRRLYMYACFQGR